MCVFINGRMAVIAAVMVGLICACASVGEGPKCVDVEAVLDRCLDYCSECQGHNVASTVQCRRGCYRFFTHVAPLVDEQLRSRRCVRPRDVALCFEVVDQTMRTLVSDSSLGENYDQESGVLKSRQELASECLSIGIDCD